MENGAPANGPHFTPPSLRGGVGGGGGGGGGDGGEGEVHGRVKRESLGRAGGLQTPVRPRRSADRRPMPPRVALLTLFAAPMNRGPQRNLQRPEEK
jgi:hypothetical protein